MHLKHIRDGRTHKAAALQVGSFWVRCREATRWDFGASHLVVWVELAAVNIVVVTPQRSDQLSRVEGIDGD